MRADRFSINALRPVVNKIKSDFQNDRFWFIDDGPMWDSLENLVAYYCFFADGLICK